MVTKWGMGRDPESADGGVSGRGTLSFLVPTQSRSLPSDVQGAATRAIRAILDEAYAQASQTLIAHMETLRRLAAYLVEHERVDGAVFDELFDGRLAVPSADDEWRAATSRPREWGDVVDLAARRSQRDLPAPAAAATAAIVGTPAPPVSDDAPEAIGEPSVPAAATAAVVAATSTDVAVSQVSLPADVATAHTAVASEPMSTTTIVTRPPKRPRLRRSTSRRVRHAAAEVLHRAEGWLRPRQTGEDQL
jgi:hypothetical protein